MAGYWKELVTFIRSMFNAAFKTNPWMERVVMEGITRSSKEFIFSDLNNLKVVATASDECGTTFGFTEEVVFTALEAKAMENREVTMDNGNILLIPFRTYYAKKKRIRELCFGTKENENVHLSRYSPTFLPDYRNE